MDRLPSSELPNTNALPPSELRDLWGVGTVYGRMLTYPLRFNTYLGNQGDICVQGRTRMRFYKTKVRS